MAAGRKAASGGRPEWTVLLIGGHSGAGKSRLGRGLGRRLGRPWLQVDDLRLALQWSRASLPEGTDALYFFERTPAVFELPPERLRDGLIAVGRAMTRAIEVVVASHLALDEPIIVEGDGLLPALAARSHFQDQPAAGRVRAVYLVEPAEEALLANMLARGRGLHGQAPAALRNQARAYWLYGRWLADEAARHGLPLLTPRPWSTLTRRALAAASGEEALDAGR